jgi:hypothetical protein
MFRLLLVFVLLLAACSEPPQKELDQAQGAIDAAHAAGADMYAADAYNGAVQSLQKAHDSVDQRDYRQALSYAIEAREGAKDAARAAADAQAKARATAEAQIAELLALTQQLDTGITAAQTVRVPARDLRDARATLADARDHLQEAGAAVTSKKYREATSTLTGVREKLNAAIKAIDAQIQKPARRRR